MDPHPVVPAAREDGRVRRGHEPESLDGRTARGLPAVHDERVSLAPRDGAAVRRDHEALRARRRVPAAPVHDRAPLRRVHDRGPRRRVVRRGQLPQVVEAPGHLPVHDERRALRVEPRVDDQRPLGPELEAEHVVERRPDPTVDDGARAASVPADVGEPAALAREGDRAGEDGAKDGPGVSSVDDAPALLVERGIGDAIAGHGGHADRLVGGAERAPDADPPARLVAHRVDRLPRRRPRERLEPHRLPLPEHLAVEHQALRVAHLLDAQLARAVRAPPVPDEGRGAAREDQAGERDADHVGNASGSALVIAPRATGRPSTVASTWNRRALPRARSRVTR